MKLRMLKGSAREIELADGWTILFSYETAVAAERKGQYYRTELNHSRTTSKHITQWLEGIRATVQPQKFFDTLAKGGTA